MEGGPLMIDSLHTECTKDPPISEAEQQVTNEGVRSVQFAPIPNSSRFDDVSLCQDKGIRMTLEGMLRMREQARSIHDHSNPFAPHYEQELALCMFSRLTTPETSLLGFHFHSPCYHTLKGRSMQRALETCLCEVV